MKYYEIWLCRKFDAIIAATPHIRNKFLSINHRCVDVNNFPFIQKSKVENHAYSSNSICYIGAISRERGIDELLSSLKYLPENIRLNLAGAFNNKINEDTIKQKVEWSRVNYYGVLTHDEVLNLLKISYLGVVTLYPTNSYMKSLPVKMFEYMSAGIPLIASNSLLGKNYKKNNCGICRPEKSKEISSAINLFTTQGSKKDGCKWISNCKRKV